VAVFSTSTLNDFPKKPEVFQERPAQRDEWVSFSLPGRTTGRCAGALPYRGFDRSPGRAVT
jgi:hypothetical protein